MNEQRNDDRQPPLSPAALAASLVKRMRTLQASQLQAIQPRPADSPVPLSFPQHQVWLVEQLQPGTAAYNVSFGTWLQGGIDIDALEFSVSELGRRHESLRTIVVEQDGEPRQVIQEVSSLRVTVHDLRHLISAEREAEAIRIAEAAAAQPFDLATGPLVRVVLCQMEAERYLLAVVAHHLVCDGWSLGVALKELSHLYSARVDNQVAPPPTMPIQYGDFARWQRQEARQGSWQTHLDYWRQQLADLPVLELRTDRPRPAVQSSEGACAEFHLPVDLSESLRQFSQSHGVTLFVTLLASFQLLLGRLSGTEDIVVGSPVANRRRPEIRDLIGFFVNTIVLRSDLSGTPTFDELLQRVQATCLHAFAHQDVPFEKLVEELHPVRDLSRSPLFQVMFALQNDSMLPRQFAGINTEPVELGTGAVRYDLELQVWEGSSALRLRFDYSTALFDRETIQRLFRCYQTLLEEVVARPHQKIVELQVMSAAERRLLLEQVSHGPQMDYLACHSHQLFEAQAERNPDAVALTTGHDQVTYRELNRRANQIAHLLRSLGVGPHKLVGVFMERTSDLVATLLGIWKAEGTYVPFDPAYPEERVSFMLQDSGVSLVITQAPLRQRLPEGLAQVLCLDQVGDQLAEQPEANPIQTGTPMQPAYVLYTSGSTGRPKGVAIGHRSVMNFVHWARTVFGGAELAGVFAGTSICFDLSVFELFVPLSWGGKVVLAKDALHLASHPAAGQVTLINTVPSAITELLAMGCIPQSAVTVNLAGEPLQNSLVQQIYQHAHIKRVHNLYGPSETTTYSTFTLVARGAMESPTIGRPIANTQVYLLDRYLNPVPLGVPGELYIGGDGVALGYWNRPDLTGERFIADPFSTRSDALLYKTGDLGCFRPDGTIEYLGRTDFQVKLRGFRIELGEIESALGQHQAVRQAAAAVTEVATGDRRLVAYLVPSQPGMLPAPGDLRSYLRSKLPEYMIPSEFVMLDALPLSPNGKINRKALPVSMAVQDLSSAAPATPLEKQVAGAWSEVLGIGHIGAHTDFFAAGGHSLLATRAVRRLGQDLGLEIPLRLIFEQPTVAEFAAALASLGGPGSVRPEIPRLPRIAAADGPELAGRFVLPASFGQERLWFLAELESGQDTAYNMSGAVRIHGRLDREAFARSLHTVVNRHEALRTSFRMVEGELVQVVEPEAAVPLTTVDLRDICENDRAHYINELAAREAAQPFDLSQAPLVRSRLLCLGEAESVLLLTMHHIISDGWSLDIFVRELAQVYDAIVHGRRVSMAELPIQYADFAAWQRERFSGDDLQRQLEYWRQQLAGLPVLNLPTDRPRPAVSSRRTAVCTRDLPAPLVSQLEHLGRSEGATLYMLLLGAFQTLLSRYTGQEEIAVGSPIANRSHPNLDALIGFFVNTLVLRTDLSDHPSFRTLLQRVREVCMQAYDNQEVPFEKLVEDLRPDRDTGLAPLVQAMFVLQETLVKGWELPGVTLELMETGLGAAKFDLVLTVTRTGSGLKAAVEYNVDLFDGTTVERMLGHFCTLLEGAAKAPECSVYELPLLTAEEREQILASAAAVTSHNVEGLTHDRFERHAGRAPNSLALVCRGQALTYADLNRRANQVAHWLRKQGVGPNVVVSLCMERSADLIVGMLGVLKAGGAYLPLDPVYPPERVAFMLTDAQAGVLLTQEKFLANLPVNGVKLLCLDRDWHEVASESTVNPESGARKDHLAYVIYTSGSTGRPKGVEITHRSLEQLVDWYQPHYNIGPGVKTSQLAGVAFDAVVFEVWPSLTAGASVYMPDNETRLSPTALRDWLVAERIEVSFVPTPIAQEMIKLPWPRETALRTVQVGGDKLLTYPPADLPFRLVNNYGPTENTVVATAGTVPAGVESVTPPTIGRPVAYTELYILDGRMELLPVGVPGEICLGGPALARGYRNRPDLTAERFVPHPFKPGERLYKTGDLARLRADGELEFLGRTDHQVKIRGMRIELGEIEAALLEHPTVQAAVAVLHQAELVAYVVPAAAAPAPASGELRNHLKTKLPEYMVPAAFLFLESLPLTPNGKVDRRALPVPAHQPERQFTAPTTRTEACIAAIWAEVLGLEAVGIHDDFFDLGGHSLLAVKVSARLRDELGLEIPLRLLFERRTVAEIAAALRDQGTPSPAGPQITPIERIPAESGSPFEGACLFQASFGQQRLWFLNELAVGGSAAYNVSGAVNVRGTLQLPCLTQAVNHLITRHETLRTSFATVNGQLCQVIAPAASIAIPQVDLTSADEATQTAELQRLASEEARKPFDLQARPLLRVALISLSDQAHVLLVTMHHIISDGWSLDVFTKELAELYQARLESRESLLAPLTVQYADFTQWQHQWLRSDALERQRAYWKEQLAGSPPLLELPTDRPRPATISYRGAMETWNLPPELAQKLRELSRQQRVSLFMTLLAAFQAFLHRYTGQDDIVVGSPVANRNWTETEGMIGFFVNTLALRTDLSGNPTFTELLNRVRNTTLGAYENQDLPFDQVVEAVQPKRSLSYSPLFQVMFALRNASTLITLPECELETVELDSGTAKFDLTVSLTEGEQGIGGSIVYNQDLFDAPTIRRMVGHYQNLLEQVTLEPARGIAQLPMMTGAEHRQMQAWNQTRTAYPRHATIPALFAAQAERTPEAVALVMGDRVMTYGELHRRSNQVAHSLRKLGVGPDDLVGIASPRSMELIVGLLAILKAGGAYVPLDPALPQERLSFMVADTGLSVVLAQSGHDLPFLADGVQVPDLAGDYSDECDENLPDVAGSENLAYVIYTSGSTGTPKGVGVPHRGVMRLVMGTNYASFGPGETFLQVSTISFDAATFEVWGALLHGARLVLMPVQHFTLAELGETIQRYQVTTMWMTAGLFHQMVDQNVSALRNLRQLLVGGDVVNPVHMARALRQMPDSVLINGYGPTENTTFTCTHSMKGEPVFACSVPIGRPIANTTVYVLDDYMQPVPVGVPGELYTGGDGLARGYINRPELTSQKFVPNPFESGTYLYRTGDMVRYLPDGSIEFLGRKDQQVKIRGFRIELGEIEAILSHYPAVRQAAVVARQSQTGEKQLFAYLVAAEESVSPADLRTHLRQKLPEYMVPAGFMFIEALPLTSNGKVDYPSLPDPTFDRRAAGSDWVAPRTPVEEALAHIWEQLLGLEQVGVEDNFFDLGGHSLLATQLAARIRDTFQVEVPLRALFETPTIAGLTLSIVQAQMAQSDAETLAKMLEQVEHLSEEEIAALLAREDVEP